MNATGKDEMQTLRESEEKYRKMIENANDAIFAIDTETARIIEINPKAEELTGFPASKLIGMNVRDLHPADEKDAADHLFKEVLRKGCAVYNDLHFMTRSGTKVAVDVSASVISYGSKKIIQRICRDVTERRKLQEMQEAQRVYYEFILNMMPVGLGVLRDVNAVPSVEFENKRLKEMFSESAEDSATGRWYDRPFQTGVPTKAMIDDTGVYAEERYYKDGRVYQFTLSYYRNLEGSWSELQLIRDVTERRKLEDALRAAKEHLEQKVEERTLELRKKQSQLVQSEKMAALGHLVAGVAHEINTPLGALKSNNDLAIRSLTRIKSYLEERAQSGLLPNHTDIIKLVSSVEGLDTINKTALERIVTIVRSLRDFARLDQADQDEVDIHEGLDSTLTLVHHQFKNRVNIHRDYGKLPKVSCFPNQLNQVFMNILVNSSQAIEDKGDIFIKTYSSADRVVIEIRDTGRGIPKESLDKIFDPGFTTKGAGVGTGLGLSIVYQIIQDHRGEIKVDSEVGKGTTLRIILPIR
ncbi:MAG: PAS domain S-box protein [Candidatus Krumholzibacteria bacterium]|nr:PAS domain S-box protein [Candidatus Krumholzibacteria bacterium]